MRKLNITELQRLSTKAFKQTSKPPLVIILDNVRSLHNVGAIFRTSDAFLIEKIYLCGITPTPPHPDLHKTALGAEDSVSWTYSSTTEEVVNKLHKKDYLIFAVEQVDFSTKLDEMAICAEKKYALILGNEVKGVQQSVIDSCDGAIEIPQFGTKHSLNVSISAGLVIWEFAKKLIKKK